MLLAQPQFTAGLANTFILQQLFILAVNFQLSDPSDALVDHIKTVIRSQATYAKGFLRGLYSETAELGPTAALSTIARRMLGSGASTASTGAKAITRVLIVRDFARQRPELLKVPKTSTKSKTASKRKRVDDGLDLGTPSTLNTPDPAMNPPTTWTAGDKKRGGSLWEQFQAWLEEKEEDWGKFTAENENWKSFIEKCIEAETRKFPTDKIQGIPRTISSTPSTPLPSRAGTPHTNTPASTPLPSRAGTPYAHTPASTRLPSRAGTPHIHTPAPTPLLSRAGTSHVHAPGGASMPAHSLGLPTTPFRASQAVGQHANNFSLPPLSTWGASSSYHGRSTNVTDSSDLASLGGMPWAQPPDPSGVDDV
ncbi:hypothetical protein C8R42DRAFT_343163 [Lentinula raphanica]|nr:hypothetical protein C8R42DRAFT_343163 [Lentinula raphanica]